MMHHEHPRVWAAASRQNTLAGAYSFSHMPGLALTPYDYLLNALKAMLHWSPVCNYTPNAKRCRLVPVVPSLVAPL